VGNFTTPDSDAGDPIAVDSDGNVYVVGATQSTGFPSGLSPVADSTDYPAIDSCSDASNTNAFMTELQPNGALHYSTCIGGGSTDNAYGVAVKHTACVDEVYVVGSTSSSDLPTGTIAGFQ